jgi:tetratricopeptide (TPR) repeat protein
LKEDKLSGKKLFWISCIIFLLALSVRFFYLYESSDSPIFKAPIVDARGYDFAAREFVQKHKIDSFFFWQQFFYPFFLSIVYFFSGCSILAAKIIQVILGSLTCVLTFLLARKIFNFKTGIAAGLIVIFYGPLIFHETDLISAGWEAFWAAASLILFLKAAEKPNYFMYILLGICGALSALTRPNFLIFFFAGCVWLGFIYYKKIGQIKTLKAFALIVVPFFITVLPAAILNYEVSGHFGIMPASGGINFYIGNNPNLDAASIRPGPQWDAISTMPLKYGVKNNMWAKQKFFYRKAFESIAAKPADFINGLINKTMQLLSSREMPGNVDVYLFRDFSGLLKILMWKAGRFGFPFGLILPLSVVGLVFYWRQIPIVLKLFLLLYPLPLIAAHIESRYRIGMIPVIAILAVGGAEAFVRYFKQPRYLLVAIILFVLAMLVSVLPGPFAAEKINYLPELYNSAGITMINQGRSKDAEESYKKAISLNPNYSEAYYNLGVLYFQSGENELAVQNYEKALQYDPNDYKSHYNLGVISYGMGNYEFAKNQLMEALRIKSDYLPAHKALVMDFIRRDEIDNAIEELKQILKIEPNDANAHFQLGMLQIQKENFDSAIEELEKALELNPENKDARHALDTLKKILNK